MGEYVASYKNTGEYVASYKDTGNMLHLIRIRGNRLHLIRIWGNRLHLRKIRGNRLHPIRIRGDMLHLIRIRGGYVASYKNTGGYVAEDMISIILACGKHLHDHIISLGGEVWSHKTSLIHHCSSIEVTRGFEFTSFSTMFQLDFLPHCTFVMIM